MFKKQIGIFFLLFTLVFPGQMLAATPVSSSVTNPVWTPDNSPYVVSGVINVAKGATLVIQPGTEVRFNPGAKIVVDGELDVLGTAANPVTMTLNNNASSTVGYWDGIEFSAGSVNATMENNHYVKGSIIQNTIIKFSKGIKLDDAAPYIANNQLINNNVGIEIDGDNGPVGSLVMSSTDVPTNNVNPLYITGNTINDNTVGIVINRNNSRNFVVTPAGYSYIGPKVTTAYIDNNIINSNKVGISIVKGDNNIILSNTIKYNSVAGIQSGNGTRSNAFEKNEINNNEIGLYLLSADSFVIQNNIKNNFNTGLVVSQAPALLKYNNIYNNQKYNLDNFVYNLAAAENYWGTTNEGTIAASLLITGVSATSTATSTATTTQTYPVDYSSLLVKDSDTTSIVDPIIDDYATSTLSSVTYISGFKPVDADVYINGEAIANKDSDFVWQKKVDLNLGNNGFAVYYQDNNGKKSGYYSLTILRQNELTAPTVNIQDSATTSASILLSGTKEKNSSVIINGNEIVPISALTTWSYNYPLNIGVNSLDIKSANSNQTSAVISLKITRTKDVAADVVAEEQKHVTKVDAKISAKMAGHLLLQVENKGYIWYVNPKNNKRYLVDNSTALSVFRSLALGISEKNLALIPTAKTTKANALGQKLKGKLLLRIEKGGQISYIDINGYRHDISQANLMTIFRSLGLGISNANIWKIAIGTIK